jgi:hypothetical protein
MIVFDAPTMGSGKALLADITAMIATGKTDAGCDVTGDEAGDRKRITAILVAGDPVVLFDNIGRVLKGDVLSALLTSEDRILGASQTVTVTNLTTWMATGNNLDVGGDLATRVLICRIDAGIGSGHECDPYSYFYFDEPVQIVVNRCCIRCYSATGGDRNIFFTTIIVVTTAFGRGFRGTGAPDVQKTVAPQPAGIINRIQQILWFCITGYYRAMHYKLLHRSCITCCVTYDAEQRPNNYS